MENAAERAQSVSVGLFLPRRFGRVVGLTPEPAYLVGNWFTGCSVQAQAIARYSAPQTVDLGKQ